ncbi:MAG: hypothetical protein A2V88_07305 [Elusimicrobia bacterium RBG_16_66_12]|nr:MAG: hypothetical protein A2V88_07305 [Elusimicrobia bacterium RBG_16_66_12]
MTVAFNVTRNASVATKVEKADTTASRNKGLLGRESLAADEGLWITPCPMIHTFFMKFPIDVIFLKRDLTVARVIEGLKPWRLSPWVFSAHSVLELQGGMLNGSVRAGDRLEMRPS